MVFKDFKTFKQTFNKLFKKYHPDNLETGDAEKFMNYKKMYDKIIEIKNNQVRINITTTQAFLGTTINTEKFTIIIPPNYYQKKPFIDILGKDGKKYKIYIHIIADQDEYIKYDEKHKDLIIIKYVPINIFEIILGCEKTITVLGEMINLKISPFDVLKNPTKVLHNKGYIKRNKKERNDLTIMFKYVNTELSNNDIKIIKDMSRRYE